MAEKIPVIYDTDLGEDIDDLYALYLALFHPRLELKAVTTAHGDTQLKARLAEKVLRMAGRTDIPVAAGIGMSKARIERGQTTPDPRQCATYQSYVFESDPEYGHTYPYASDVILEILSASAAPVSLIGEGAMSNLAETVQRATPEQRAMIGSIAVMGGETQAVMSEYNVVCDPEAADVVLSSGIPVFLGTYHLTARLIMTMGAVEEHFGNRNNPVLKALYECTQLWAPHRGLKPGPVLYDLVPVFWVAEPGCVKTRRSTIRVELEGTYTRGQTVRISSAEEGPVFESLELDGNAMVREFLDILDKAARALRA